MSYAASGGAVAAHAAMANAVKASGSIVQVEIADFETVLRKVQNPLVVYAKGSFWESKYKYLTSYKGLTFVVKCSEPLMLPLSAEVIQAKKIWVPGSW